jgi:hypothetical protein
MPEDAHLKHEWAALVIGLTPIVDRCGTCNQWLPHDEGHVMVESTVNLSTTANVPFSEAYSTVMTYLSPLQFGSAEYFSLAVRRQFILMLKRAERLSSSLEYDVEGEVSVDTLRRQFPALRSIRQEALERHVVQALGIVGSGKLSIVDRCARMSPGQFGQMVVVDASFLSVEDAFRLLLCEGLVLESLELTKALPLVQVTSTVWQFPEVLSEIQKIMMTPGGRDATQFSVLAASSPPALCRAVLFCAQCVKLIRIPSSNVDRLVFFQVAHRMWQRLVTVPNPAAELESVCRALGVVSGVHPTPKMNVKQAVDLLTTWVASEEHSNIDCRIFAASESSSHTVKWSCVFCQSTSHETGLCHCPSFLLQVFKLKGPIKVPGTLIGATDKELEF